MMSRSRSLILPLSKAPRAGQILKTSCCSLRNLPKRERGYPPSVRKASMGRMMGMF